MRTTNNEGAENAPRRPVRRSPKGWRPLVAVLLAAGAFIIVRARQTGAPVPASGWNALVSPLPWSAPDPNGLALIDPPRTPADRIVNAAKREVLNGVAYDASYRSISYPNGDVRKDRGACTDVVIRALRAAGHDLQRLMHEDMRHRFSEYPRAYGLRRPDRNIDHRRCLNQMAFFRKYGRELSTSTVDPKSWKPGDIVYTRLPSGLLHTGVCSNVRNGRGLPLVIHNLGVTAQEDVLGRWELIGRFRYPA